ncbi:MAG: DMT family transporter [Holosporaceae bacterium]|jgi:S-adenosylmethionine uptake transporter|nr:DMT family transporter [Holosporaceae bacterium]
MDRKKQGYLFFICGVCLYSFSDAIMKYFMPFYGVHQVTFLRAVFRFLPFMLWAIFTGLNPLKTRRLKENVFRSMLASLGTYSIMCAYNYSSLTDVFVVGLTSSIFIIPLSIWILKEKFSSWNCLAVLLGFAGICVALRPGGEILQLGILFAALGAIISALNQVIIKRLASTESELTIIFYHHLFLIALSSSLATMQPVGKSHFFMLILGGMIGAAAQYSMIHSFKLSSSSGLASAGYFMLIPNTLLDYFLYDKIPDLYIASGLILILIGIWIAFKLQSRIVNSP